jgi:hypothetical protein
LIADRSTVGRSVGRSVGRIDWLGLAWHGMAWHAAMRMCIECTCRSVGPSRSVRSVASRCLEIIERDLNAKNQWPPTSFGCVHHLQRGCSPILHWYRRHISVGRSVGVGRMGPGRWHVASNDDALRRATFQLEVLVFPLCFFCVSLRVFPCGELWFGNTQKTCPLCLGAHRSFTVRVQYKVQYSRIGVQ